MTKSKTIYRLFLSIGVTLAIGVLFFQFTPSQDLFAQLKQVEIQWHYLPLFFIAVLLNIYLRGEALALLINSQTDVAPKNWMAISSAHNLSTSLSGLILGDAVLFWLLNRFDIHWQKSLFTTLITRFFEVPWFVLILFVGFFLTPTLFPTQQIWTLLSGLTFVLTISLLFWIGWLVDWLPRGLWLGQGEKVERFVQAYRLLSDRCMKQLLFLNVGKILTGLLFYIFAMRMFSIDLTVGEECFVFGIFTFASLFPIQGILGLGTFEAYFSMGLILLGWQGAEVLVLGFFVHMLFLTTFVLITLYFFFSVFLASKTANE